MAPVRVAVVGMGFMGRTHLGAYARAQSAGEPCVVAGVCDRDHAKCRAKARAPGAAGVAAQGDAGGNLDTDGDEVDGVLARADLLRFTELDALLASDQIDLVSICTHTDTHAPFAERALRAGKHVLVEKPVAITSAAIDALADVADASGLVCMPAMCMRFWPGWDWLAQTIGEGSMGRVLSARFERLGAAPGWGEGFYSDAGRSGGALFDLHVHDADFIRHAFGMPGRVDSVGTEAHVSTRYEVAGGPGLLIAEGGWLNAPGAAFRMRFVVEFERGVADFDLARDPALLVHDASGSRTPELKSGTGYDHEVRHAVRLAAGLETVPIATMREAADVTRILEAERDSIRVGGPVRPAALGTTDQGRAAAPAGAKR
ncbi:MAG: Gfo/Idh/MocA family oxidoreductase [Planctomycetota bacterium]